MGELLQIAEIRRKRDVWGLGFELILLDVPYARLALV
tara:strand:+ start:1559 stop:1669 length:111 start_codon:yes stop_codon:yes gene_type:complete